MALPKLYDLITWHNNTTPALNEDNLNAMSQAIDDIDDRVIGLAGTIMEDVPQIQQDMEILEPAIESIDSNVARAETAADNAEEDALKSEGYAVGEQDGVEVTSGEYYQNNAKYYAEIANPPIENTVDFTDIITISDAINKAAKDVRLKVEAVQDLHGYAYPWVGGAGKNRFTYNLDGLKAANTAGTWSGNVYSYIGLTFTVLTDSANNVLGIKVNGISNNSGYFYFGTMTLSASSWKLNGAPTGATATVSYIRVGKGAGNSFFASCVDGADKSIDITATDSYMFGIAVPEAGAVNNNLTYTPMLRDPSASATYESPTNICPISGWDNAKVTRSGKNLFDISKATNSRTTVDLSTNTATLTATGNYQGSAGITAKVKTGDYYTLSATLSTNAVIEVSFMDDSGNTTRSGVNIIASNLPWTFHVDDDGTTVVRFILANRTAGAGTYTFSNVQVEKGQTATDYEPYQGEELTISLNGTRYGGTLDVTSGVLTVDKVYQDMGDLSWTYYSPTQVFFTMGLASLVKPPSSTSVVPNAICSHYPLVAANQVASKDKVLAFETNGQFNAKDTNYTVAATFKTAMSGVQLVYELATPQTIQLTPTQVYLLYGYNTLFGDCGDISLTYDASGIIHIEEAKLDTETLKTIAAASSDFADFKARIAAL